MAVFTFLVPPFQKPDEQAHYHRAISLTNLDIVCHRDENGEGYFPMERRYAELPEVLHTWDVAFRYEVKFQTEWLRADFSDPSYSDEGRIYRFCSLTPFGYLPNALGALLGKPLQNPLPGFYLGRLFGALFFVACVVLAVRIVPERYKLLVYLYAGIPMVLHQVGAHNYDAVQLSLFPIAFALLMRFIVFERPLRHLELLAFLGVLIWLIQIRLISYFPLVLLFFAVRPWQVHPQPRQYALIAAGFLVFALWSTAVLGAIYLPASQDSAPGGFGIDSSAQMRYLLAHPWQFPIIFYNTLHIFGDLLLRELIGVFGWIDYGFNFALYYAVVFFAGAIVYHFSDREVRLVSPFQLLVIAGAIAGTVILLFVSLYAVWSPVGADAVSGLQGRYFVGLLPFTVFAIAQLVAMVGRAKLLPVLAVVLALFVSYQVFRAVDLRYYGPPGPLQPPAIREE